MFDEINQMNEREELTNFANNETGRVQPKDKFNPNNIRIAMRDGFKNATGFSDTCRMCMICTQPILIDDTIKRLGCHETHIFHAKCLSALQKFYKEKEE